MHMDLYRLQHPESRDYRRLIIFGRIVSADRMAGKIEDYLPEDKLIIRIEKR